MQVQVDSPIDAWSDISSNDLQNKQSSMAIHDTECPYWDQVLLKTPKKTPELKSSHDKAWIANNLS